MFKRYVSGVLAAVIGAAVAAKRPLNNQDELKALAHAEFAQASTTYEQLMYAGITLQDLNELTDSAKAQGCQSLTKVQKDSDMSVRETFNQAEVLRLFGCANLKQEVEQGVVKILGSKDFSEKLSSADDLFYAYSLYKNQNLYLPGSSKQGDALVDFLIKTASSQWLSSKASTSEKFDTLTWQFQGQGFSESTTRFVQMIAELAKDSAKIREEARSSLTEAFEKIHETAYFSGKNQAFYVTQTMPMNVLEINYHLYMAESIFNEKADDKTFAKDTVKRQQYFATKAQLATNVQQAAFSLEALKELSKEVPFMVYTGQNGAFNFVDYLGQPMTSFPTSADDVKLVRLLDYQMGSTQLTPDDYTVQKGEIKVKSEKHVGRRWLLVETQKGVLKCADAMTTSEPKKNEIKKVAYEHNHKEGTVWNKRDGLPIKQATDGETLYLNYEQSEGAAQFTSVYLRVKKTDYMPERQIPISKRGNTQTRQIKFNFDELNLINGDYDFTLVGVTSEGLNSEFPLGSINVWFKEGNVELVNDGIHEDYFPKPQIIAQFPEPHQEGSPVKSYVFCGLVAVCALLFIKNLMSLGPNSENMTFSGILAMGAVLGVMGIILGFWFGKANLLQTLWLMAPLSFIWLFVVSNGIVASNDKQ